MSITQIPIGGVDTDAPIWLPTVDSDSGVVNFNSPTSQKKFLVMNAPTVDALIASAVDPNIPATNTVGSVVHFFQDYKWQPTSPTSGSTWEVTVNYGFSVEYFELSFDTSGERTKIFTALDEGDYYDCIKGPAGVDDLPSFEYLIGVGDDGKAEGTEIPIGKFDFTVLVRNKFSTLPSDYIATLKKLSGKANDAPVSITWKGQVIPFDAEELVYLGTAGKMTSDDGFEITLKFSSQTSVAGGTTIAESFTQPDVGETVAVTVADVEGFADGDEVYISGGLYTVTDIDPELMTMTLTYTSGGVDPGEDVDSGEALSTEEEPIVIGKSGPIEKKGWRYLWQQAKQVTANGRRQMRPSVAVVNKVIKTADLSALGIFD